MSRPSPILPTAEQAAYLATFPEKNPNPIIEIAETSDEVHYANPAAVRLFPTICEAGWRHPYLAELNNALRSRRGKLTGVIQLAVEVDGRMFALTVDPLPELHRWRVYGTDITERKLAEDRLRESLREVNDLRAALDEHAIVAVTDPQGKITFVNDKFCAISKYSREELLGQDHRIINSGHHSKEFIRELWTTIARGRVWHGEIRNRAKDGSFYWVDTTIVPSLDEEGKPRQYVAIRADITARKHAEEEIHKLNTELEQRVAQRTAQLETANAELRHSRAELTSLFESLPGLYLVLTPDLKIVAVSDAYLKATMTTREGILGRGLFEVFPDNPDDPGATGVSNLQASLDRVRQNVAPDTMAIQKYDVRRPDGTFEERYWSPMNSPLLGPDRQIDYIIHRVEDVTDFVRQKSQHAGNTAELRARVEQMEAEIFQSSQKVQAANQQLEAANKELEAFSYSVSHDLRAPLRTVDGFSQAVLEDYGALLPPEGHRHLQIIRQGAQRMGNLIDDLLTFARLSRVPLTRHRIDTTRLVREVWEDAAALHKDRQVEFHLADLPPCHGDAALLKQVWINLLSNALKYSGKRTPAVIEVGHAEEAGSTVYFVRDNGAGFDMRFAGKLFGVFQRLHRAEEYQGTGVGLAIVQRVIHRHGGRIWVTAEVDRGATFSFTLAEGSNA